MMNDSSLWRIAIFLGTLGILFFLERWVPKRKWNYPQNFRYVRNFGLLFISQLLVKYLLPFSVGGVAILAQQKSWGLFNLLEINTPWLYWTTVAVSIILLDFFIYLQHVVFHWVPALWRLHKVHHIDHDLDVSSGIRFHPLEILLSVLLKALIVIVFGIPFEAVLLFEIVLNVMAMFTHSNIKLSPKLNQVLHYLFVTPDMHRIHHSVIAKEHHSNFGFHLACWDKLFGTYTAHPKYEQEKMVLGLNEYKNFDKTNLWNLLWIPWTNPQK